MYSLHLFDIFTRRHQPLLHPWRRHLRACCTNGFSASALGANLLIHYGHYCFVPIDATQIPCLYVFVEIKINVDSLIKTIKLNFGDVDVNRIVFAGTTQFSAVIWAAKPELERAGFRVSFLGWRHCLLVKLELASQFPGRADTVPVPVSCQTGFRLKKNRNQIGLHLVVRLVRFWFTITQAGFRFGILRDG
ncbi:Diphthamide synthesis DPH1/DPH2 [Dillenia turbinata]|uniref:Diphthamide synthesis DPH1/DPH2 n=1 Tax=Dillenia turbinata TaxID=194707 RepID=A0AAN8ZGT0_9MAGN